jgi:L-threonylcarbamoyladenylate synthase
MPSAIDQEIRAAVGALRRGEIIGLPTETVYGLAADASNPEAVRRLFELKERPADHPVIVHLADAGQLGRWARKIPEGARKLAEAFWPGPLTLILPRAATVGDFVTGGQDTVGLRVPGHPLALRVLREFGGGVAAPSANRFGRVSPTRASHVVEEFGGAVPIVIDGGDCEIGIESTIVEVNERGARILRPGRISAAEIGAVVGGVLEGADTGSSRVSGGLPSHYAPRTPVQLIAGEQLRARSVLSLRPCRVIARTALAPGVGGILLGEDPKSYARGLYAALRDLDGEGASRILVERPPETPAWQAIRDRLERAAAGGGLEDEEP